MPPSPLPPPSHHTPRTTPDPHHTIGLFPHTTAHHPHTTPPSHHITLTPYHPNTTPLTPPSHNPHTTLTTHYTTLTLTPHHPHTTQPQHTCARACWCTFHSCLFERGAQQPHPERHVKRLVRGRVSGSLVRQDVYTLCMFWAEHGTWATTTRVCVRGG